MGGREVIEPNVRKETTVTTTLTELLGININLLKFSQFNFYFITTTS